MLVRECRGPGLLLNAWFVVITQAYLHCLTVYQMSLFLNFPHKKTAQQRLKILDHSFQLFSVESFLLSLTFHPGRALRSLLCPRQWQSTSLLLAWRRADPPALLGLVPPSVSHMLEWACSVYGCCSRVGFLHMNLSCGRNGAGISPRVFSAFCWALIAPKRHQCFGDTVVGNYLCISL